MKKFYSLLAMALLGTATAMAQMFAYSVEKTTTAFTPITGGTVVEVLDPETEEPATGTAFGKMIVDADGTVWTKTTEDAPGFPIGFDFAFNGKAMKYFIIGTDGFVLLSPDAAFNTSAHKASNGGYFTYPGTHDMVGVMNRGGVLGNADTKISYKLSGEAGNHVLTVEFLNLGMQSYWYDAKQIASASVQYSFYEATGNVEFKVNNYAIAADASYRMEMLYMGILGNAGDFLVLKDYEGNASTSNSGINYSPESYPADGSTYTFVAPEPCEMPTQAPSALAVASTSTRVSGTFTVGNADRYLVLMSTDAALTEQPADKVLYAKNAALGNATVVDVLQSGEFQTANNLTPGTTYYFFVYGYSYECSAGPIYNPTAVTASVVTKPVAPKSVEILSWDKTFVQLKVEANGDAPVLVAMSDMAEVNYVGQVLDNGNFGQPEGSYNVGDAITFTYTDYETEAEVQGQNKVVYVGTSGTVSITDLQPGKDYYFRAWSSDGNGNYSSLYAETAVVTVAELPWAFQMKNFGGFDPVGWTKDGVAAWSSNNKAAQPYFNNQINAASEAEPGVAWILSPYIYLSEGTNTVSIDIAACERIGRFGYSTTDWAMAGDDVIKVQVTMDGVEFKDLIVIDKDHQPVVLPDEENEIEGGNYFQKGVFTNFTADFTDYAGQKVQLRLYTSRQTQGQVWFANLQLKAKEATEQGMLLPFDVVIKEQTSMDDWTCYWGELATPTVFSPCTSQYGGFHFDGRQGNALLEFSPEDEGVEHWWYVSPLITLGNDATQEYEISMGVNMTMNDDPNGFVSFVVSKDAKTFNEADVVYTIKASEMPATGATGEIVGKFSGYTGNVLLGIYVSADKVEGELLPGFNVQHIGMSEATGTGISRTSANAGAATVSIYNGAGQTVSSLKRGLNIVRYDNGQVRKLLVK